MSPENKTCQSNMEDTEVIHIYLKHQASNCFDLLYRRYGGKIFSKCISMLKDEALAHDATQEIFTKIFLNLSKFNAKSRFSTWVYSITYNYCIDYIRRKKKRANLFMNDIERLPEVEDEVSDDEILSIATHQLKIILEELDDSERAILLMKYQDGMSIKEIAELLGKTESAVKMRIKRAKEKAKYLKKTIFKEEVL